MAWLMARRRFGRGIRVFLLLSPSSLFNAASGVSVLAASSIHGNTFVHSVVPHRTENRYDLVSGCSVVPLRRTT